MTSIFNQRLYSQREEAFIRGYNESRKCSLIFKYVPWWILSSWLNREKKIMKNINSQKSDSEVHVVVAEINFGKFRAFK